MRCENCGENEVNVKYKQIVNGVEKRMNLCEDCARKLGIDISFNMPEMSFASLIDNVFNDIDFMPNLIRPEALLSDRFDNDFIPTLKVTPKDTDEFDDILKNIQKKEKEVKEKQSKSENKLEELKEKLDREIKEERYEDAAKTRDEIKKLES